MALPAEQDSWHCLQSSGRRSRAAIPSHCPKCVQLLQNSELPRMTEKSRLPKELPVPQPEDVNSAPSNRFKVTPPLRRPPWRLPTTLDHVRGTRNRQRARDRMCDRISRCRRRKEESIEATDANIAKTARLIFAPVRRHVDSLPATRGRLHRRITTLCRFVRFIE